MKSLFYVSVRTMQIECDVNAIVTWSRARNAELDLTGALVVTPRHFAQILEGTQAAIDGVMKSISRDPRHRDLVIGPMEQKARRDFHRWTLAYHGESSYVSELVASALEAPAFEVGAHAQNIRSLMAMFA